MHTHSTFKKTFLPINMFKHTLIDTYIDTYKRTDINT